MTRAILRIALLLSLLSACAPAAGTSSPVAPAASLTPFLPVGPAEDTPTLVLPPLLPTDSPTASQSAPETSPTLEPTPSDTPVPLPTLAAATLEATSYPQPAADSGAIQILTPGPLSKVISPIKLRSYAQPGYSNRVRIELFGEDGRLLFRQIIVLNTTLKWAYFYQEVPFEVHAVGELGRLTLSTQDQYGHTTALVSVHVLLLSSGEEQITPAGNLKEHCVVDSPVAEAQVSGGTVKVTGQIRPFNSQPLVIELVSKSGSVLGSRQVSVSPASGDSYVPFGIDVFYSVTAPTPVLLVVRQTDERIPGGMYLYSQPVTLLP